MIFWRKIWGKKYSKQYYFDKISKYINNPKLLSSLYQQEWIDHKGTAKGEKELCIDIIANELQKPENIKIFDEKNKNILPIQRHTSYKEDNHQLSARRREEIFAKSLLEYKFNLIGEIIDYQTPLKDPGGGNNKKVGDVDLLAYKEKGKILFLIELKREYNDDSILHAILQIYIYYCQIDKEKLKQDFEKDVKKIQKVVLVFKDSLQHNQYKKSKPIQKLAEKLGVDVKVIDINISEP